MDTCQNDYQFEENGDIYVYDIDENLKMEDCFSCFDYKGGLSALYQVIVRCITEGNTASTSKMQLSLH